MSSDATTDLARRSLLLGACASSAIAFVPAYAVSPKLPADRAQAIHSLLSELSLLAMFNGVLTIDIGGEIVFEHSYGLADYEKNVEFTAQTRFKIASISKRMTDAALAAMLARGELRLGDSLSRYLPKVPGADRISLEHITQHRSGIQHTNDQPWGEGPDALSLDEIIARLSSLPLDFEPGTSRKYSNGGYAMLTRVLEMVHGASYPEIMQELVFDPLSMRDSGAITDSSKPIAHLAKGYQPSERIGIREAPRPYLVELRPGGGSLYASARDVMKFFQAAWRGRMPGATDNPGLFGGSGATRAADGRSPGSYMDIHYERDADMIVSSTANNYAAEFRWAENLAQLALGKPPLFATLPATNHRHKVASTHPWIGEYRDLDGTSYSHVISRHAAGNLVWTDKAGKISRALVPLRDGSFLDPMYFGIGRESPSAPGRLTFGRLYKDGFTSTLIRRGAG